MEGRWRKFRLPRGGDEEVYELVCCDVNGRYMREGRGSTGSLRAGCEGATGEQKRAGERQEEYQFPQGVRGSVRADGNDEHSSGKDVACAEQACSDGFDVERALEVNRELQDSCRSTRGKMRCVPGR